jgi:hypothetical protein
LVIQFRVVTLHLPQWASSNLYFVWALEVEAAQLQFLSGDLLLVEGGYLKILEEAYLNHHRLEGLVEEAN